MTQQERFQRLAQAIQDQTPQMLALRHELHRYPELSHHEFETCRRVHSALEDIEDLRIEIAAKGRALIVDLGPHDVPRYALRADMDALAIHEETNLSFCSQNPGVMHACGHDVHTSCLLGAVRALHQSNPDLPLRFIFQHAEEAPPSGARELVEAGAVEGVKGILALHCDPTRPVGQIGLRVGPLTAANDQFEVRLFGEGGHGARPHKTQDLVLSAAQIIQTLYHAFEREIDAREPFVFTIGVLHAGDQSFNVIPREVHFGGSIRSVYKETREQVEGLMQRVLGGMCQALNIQYELDHRPGSPPVINNAEMIRALRDSGLSLLGAEHVETCEGSMGGEDFAWYLERVPGAMMRLGTGLSKPLHNSQFVADDNAVPLGAHLLAHAVLSLSLGD